MTGVCKSSREGGGQTDVEGWRFGGPPKPAHGAAVRSLGRPPSAVVVLGVQSRLTAFYAMG